MRRPLIVAVASALSLLALGACSKKKEQAADVQAAAVERRDIVVQAEASGAVEPINLVEVKSKASGLVTRMNVETGAQVKAGELLVQVDTRDVQNQFDQTLADVRAAEARLDISRAQKRRADDLFAQRITTAQEHEAAQLDYANAQAALVRARTSLDLAKQRLEDATVTAPVSGTIIERTVSPGQVITSATGSVTGGTTLLKMADLSRVRVRALFNETDIGQVRAGQVATVTVDAYPDRPFSGVVEKIEPQAVVQQSVTMFPVLVTLDNREGLLKPGMNGEASVLVDRRENVLAIPVDAVRSMREVATAAEMLGIDPDSAAAQVRAQMQQQRPGSDAPAATPVPTGATTRESRGDVALPQERRRQLAEVSAQDCAPVTAALAKNPEVRTKLEALRRRMQSGEADFAAVRTESQALYVQLGVDPALARACLRRASGQQAGNAPASAAGANGANGAGGMNGAMQAGMPNGGQGRTRARPGLVFVKAGESWAPRVVRLGISNYDYVEVVSGLKEGEQVALLASAAMQMQRDAATQRMRNMTGGGFTGGGAQGGGRTGGAARGGGGGR